MAYKANTSDLTFITNESGSSLLSTKKENSKTDTSELEREIDRLVYGLYDLTDEEIKIIEWQK